MKFSESWLRTFADPAISTDELAHALTFGGLEVEGVEPVAPAFTGVVVGEVLAVAPHPDADRLRVCQVNTGQAVIAIVCGAPNVYPGMKVPAALPGAELPGITIKKTAVRGVESGGMLCSARELGLDGDESGLLVLPVDATPGQDVRAALDLDDRILITKPTPNRGDCLSMLGVAREVGAITGAPLTLSACGSVEPVIKDTLAIHIDAPAACARYCGRLVRGVNPDAPTPHWMQRRLTRCGVRPISAIVDITNYVMLELGQPLHAFDAAKLQGDIHVRFAASGESIELLNGQQLALAPEFLVIADSAGPVALAGIMGGAASAVDSATRDVFLESAYFDAEAIAGKSRVLGFGSESSFRFERGVDFGGTRRALERATALVLDICGGQAGAVTEAGSVLPARSAVVLRLSRVKRLLGVELGSDCIADILRRLDLSYTCGEGTFTVTPPSFRFDISIEEDLVEEVARIHGYEAIPAAAPRGAMGLRPASEAARTRAYLRRLLAARDYHEVITYSFVSSEWERDLCANSAPVALANPIASQMDVMRSSLFGGLIHSTAFNVRHKQTRVRVFELGLCFLHVDTGYEQPLRLAGAACGTVLPEQWGSPARNVDFFDVKADVEALFRPRGISCEAAEHPALHPGKSARILCEGKAVGWVGELHPRWQQKYDLPLAPVLFELDYAALAVGRSPRYVEVSKFPPVRRDIAAVFAEEVPYQAVIEALRTDQPALVSGVELFDVYRGADLGNGKKSLAFRVLLQDTRKTLTDAEVDSVVLHLRQTLQRQFNATLR